MKCVFVLGMHRSGTSLLSACINQVFGFSLGKTVMGAGSENARGYFENDTVVGLNDAILGRMGLSWMSYGGDPDLFHQVKDALRPAIDIVLDDEFGEDKIVIKDPRMCSMFPIWIDAIKGKGYDVKVILAVRSPYEVVDSLSKRCSESLGHNGIDAWMWKNQAAVSNADECLVVPYDQMLDNPDRAISRISRYIDEPPHDMSGFIDGFIDKKLKHHKSGKESKLYNKLCKMDTITDWSELHDSIGNTNKG